MGICSTETKEHLYWKAIWDMNILGSVKQFVWRTCNNLLPTKDNLANKKVIEDIFCPLCGSIKTIIHALWECPTSCNVWGEGDNPLRKWSLFVQDFWA